MNKLNFNKIEVTSRKEVSLRSIFGTFLKEIDSKKDESQLEIPVDVLI